MTIRQFVHHDRKVWADEAAFGTHRKFCLCFRDCRFFHPGQPDNCPIAQRLYEFDVEYGMTTPVYECPQFETEEMHQRLPAVIHEHAEQGGHILAPTFGQQVKEAIAWLRRWWAL